jgi:hypothetical protein
MPLNIFPISTGLRGNSGVGSGVGVGGGVGAGVGVATAGEGTGVGLGGESGVGEGVGVESNEPGGRSHPAKATQSRMRIPAGLMCNA